MQSNPKSINYESSTERELIKMWEDIKGNDTQSISRSLMRDIAKNTQGVSQETEEDVLYAKQMWDSEKEEWVAFDLWGAHYIVNYKKEDIRLRIFTPAPFQPEFEPVIWGWKTIDSSSLNEQLKENLISEYDDFYEMARQDRQEYKYEGRHQELSKLLGGMSTTSAHEVKK